MRHDGHLVRAPVRGRAACGRSRSCRPRRARRRRQARAKEPRRRAEKVAREGAHPRQPAGAVEARRAGRRAVPDRQPAADRRPAARAGRHLRRLAGRDRARDPRAVPRRTGRRCRTTAATCWSGSRSSTWPARSSASAASARGRSSSCCRAATSRTRCSSRSRRRPRRCWRTTCRKSRYRQPGERVVQGQRLMQAASDIFLGWTKGVRGQPLLLLAPAARHEGLGRRRGDAARSGSTFYARICGWTLARAHARSGDPIAIAAYLGKSDAFDRSITDFSERYADQNEQDYQAFLERRQEREDSRWSRACSRPRIVGSLQDPQDLGLRGSELLVA